MYLSVNIEHSWPVENLDCQSHNWIWSDRKEPLRRWSLACACSDTLLPVAVTCFAVLSFLNVGDFCSCYGSFCFAAEIVVGELGNVTCFIALTEETP